MYKWPALLSILFLISCGTHPTPYQAKKHDEGYFDGTLDKLRISAFKANHYTKPATARLFAEFHAIDVCGNEGKKFANVLDVIDRSVTKTVTKTDASGPTYYGGYGMYPFYSRYSGVGVGVSVGTSSSRSWNEDYVYPYIEVPYTCEDVIYRPKIIFKEISSNEMKSLVKDLKGAIQIDKIMDDSPNLGILKNGDIILTVNGERVEKVYQVIQHYGPNEKLLRLDVLRNGKRKSVNMKAVDVTDAAKVAQDHLISDACEEDDVAKKFKDVCKK